MSGERGPTAEYRRYVRPVSQSVSQSVFTQLAYH